MAKRKNENWLECALELRALGLSSIPLNSKNKPRVKWKRFQRRRPSERTRAHWAEKWPGSGLALLTGKGFNGKRGLDVLDIDEGAPPEWADRDWQAGLVHRTPSGGFHHFYPHTSGVRNSQSGLAPHVDMRGKGGLAVVPPTDNYSLMSGSYKTAQRTPPPKFLTDAIRDVECRGITRRAGQQGPSKDKTIGSEPYAPGRRNADLTGLAGLLRRQGLERDRIERGLLGMNELLCEPPLVEGEVRSIARSVAMYPKAPGAVLWEPFFLRLKPARQILYYRMSCMERDEYGTFTFTCEQAKALGIPQHARRVGIRKLTEAGLVECVHQGGKHRGDISRYRLRVDFNR